MRTKTKQLLERELGRRLAEQVIESNCPKTLKETRLLIYKEAEHAKEMSQFYSLRRSSISDFLPEIQTKQPITQKIF